MKLYIAAVTVCLYCLGNADPVRSDVTLYVAPDGRDDNAGTEDEPLQTLAGARDRVRQLRKRHPSEPVTVLFAPGIYHFQTPVTFTEEDSGSAKAPIRYQAKLAGRVRFTGGVVVRGWRRVTDERILQRLSANARGHVLVADLKKQGIQDYGKLTVHGFAMSSQPAEAELFYDDRPMTLARWPNSGFRGVVARPSLQKIVVDTDRVRRWVSEPDPWVMAYWHHNWADLHEPIVGIDPEKNVLERSPEITPRYGITPGRARWYAYNLLSELDQPGEYYLDRRSGRLYFWPPSKGGTAVLSQAEGFVRAQNLSYVTFHGITFEACRATAIELTGGSHCRIAKCTIRNVGHRAVLVRGGTYHEVYGCDVYYCGEGGIAMSGGDRPTLTPAHHNVENNHVHHYSRRCRTYRPGIAVGGVGCRIAHNLIHHGPHMALSAGGNDHLVEYNEIHNVVYESGDAGAFYVGRDWTQRGTILRYNYWHHIVGVPGLYGMTIYLDDQQCGHTIHGNLFERCSRPVFIGGGDDNIVTNNVFVDCWKAIHVDDRGLRWQKAATDDPNGTLRTRLRAMPYKSELWRKRYPNLARILEDEPNIPKRNLFAKNICAGGIWNDIYPSIRRYQTVKDNLVFEDKNWVRISKDKNGRPIRLIFEDPRKVAAIGFENLPLDKMGLYPDADRASWPVPNAVEPVTLPHDKSR